MTCSISVKGAGSKCSLQSRAMLLLGLMAHIHTNPFYTWFFVLFFIFLQHSCSPLPKCLWSPHFSVALFYFPTDEKKIDAKNKVKQKTRKFTHVLWATLILIFFFSISLMLSRPFVSYTTRYWFFGLLWWRATDFWFTTITKKKCSCRPSCTQCHRIHKHMNATCSIWT